MAQSVCKSASTANASKPRDEFVNKYVETRMKLQERRTECMHKIVDHARQEAEVIAKLEEAK